MKATVDRPTYSITKDFDWSETENNKLLFEMAAKYGIPYFSNYVNSDMEPSDVRSMCPLTGDTLVMVRNRYSGINILDISEIYNNHNQKGTNYEVWTNDGWCYGKPVQMPITRVLNITLSNGCSVKMGENHLQPIIGCKTGKSQPVISLINVKASELSVGDWIPFNNKPIDNCLGDYNLGVAVGAFAGDGSFDSGAIVYSLNNTTKLSLITQLNEYWRSAGYSTTITEYDNIISLRVNDNAASIIIRYIDGMNAIEKSLTNRVFNSSIDFKTGLIDGFRYTDGSIDKRRLYTSSNDLKNDIQMVISSLGNKALINYQDNRENRFGKNTNYRIDYPLKDRYGDFFNSNDNYNAYKIVSIEEVICNDKYLYCFEVANDDHIFMLANGLMTHNCRLRLDLRELRKKSGGFFGSGESTGSIGVVTINMPKIGYLATDKDDFYKRLDHVMDIAAESLKIKREAINKMLNDGLYPYTKRYLGGFNNHFSTIGLVGMNEACLNANWMRKDLRHQEAQDFTEEVLIYMRERLSDYQEKYGDLYNLEATPAESTSYRFAKHDTENYPDIINANYFYNGKDNDPYYTNSSHLPVGTTEDIFEALDIQDKLQVLYTSGTVFHGFLGEKLPDWRAAAKLIKMIAENYKLPYYTLSPTYSICPTHGYIVGEHFECPTCGGKTEVYSRITGYYRAVQNWNNGKTQEFKDRKEYIVDEKINPIIGFKLPLSETSSKLLNCLETPVEISNTELESSDVFYDGICEYTYYEFLPDSVVPSTIVSKVTQSIPKPVDNESIRILLTTEFCPNCPVAKFNIQQKTIPYYIMDAIKHKDLSKKYHIMSAPSLLVVTRDNVHVYSGVSEIIEYLNLIK